MSANNAIPLPVIGSQVKTACGSPEEFASDGMRFEN